jgi:hypothetical protein
MNCFEYEEMYVEYYNSYNFLDNYNFGNVYNYRLEDSVFLSIVKRERNLIKLYGNANHVVSFYRSCGYDGSLDYMLLNTVWESRLSFPKVYLDIPHSLFGWKNRIPRFTPTVHKEIDITTFALSNKERLISLNPTIENGKVVLNIPDTYAGQNTFFVKKSNKTFYNYVKDCPSNVVIDFTKLEEY